METSYNSGLVLLSIFIAILASYTALDLASRVMRTTGKLLLLWLLGGALSMGMGIWSMHFIGMLAFHVAVPLSYDLPITLISLLVAVATSGLALYIISEGVQTPRKLTVGALVMGMGIASMHYTGMAAIRMMPPIRYDPGLFLLSLLIAVGASAGALALASRQRLTDQGAGTLRQKIGSSLLMGAAIVGMHYTGMAAAIFEPGSVCIGGSLAVDSRWLAVSVSAGAFSILLLTLVVSAFDARLADQNAQMVLRLKQANDELQERANALAQAMTEEVRANAARSRMLATIVEQSGEAIITKDLQGRITNWNHAAEKMFGYTESEALGQPITILYGDDATVHFDSILRRIRSAETSSLERQLFAKDGRSLRVSLSISPLHGEGGEHLGEITIIRDITRQKQNEEALNHLNELLEQRVKDEVSKNREKDHLLIQQSRLAAMGEMLGNVAHQWRQPINALTLVLANIKDAYDFNDLSKEFLDRSVADGQRLIQKMSTTIDDFRNFFNPNKQKSHFSLRLAIEHALQLVEPSFKVHQIAIEFDKRTDVEVEGYPNEFSQVILNLLVNAKEAITGKRIESGVIRIAIRDDGNEAVIAVSDNAGGIPAEILPRIFDPYFTTKEKGSGVGLYMSKMIMGHMNGKIEARNAMTGAEFDVTLPKSS